MSARIAGVILPQQKHVVIGLTAIYGVGRETARRVCTTANVAPEKKIKDLTEGELERLRNAILSGNRKVEGDLRREVAMNIKRLVEFGSYRGRMHRCGLPVNGQRTRTNARTRKGKRKGSNK